MKTITLKSDNRSIILTDDAVELTVNSDHVAKGTDRIYGIFDSNVTLHENVENAPDDWVSSKYFYDGSNWSQNPDWQDPEELRQQPQS